MKDKIKEFDDNFPDGIFVIPSQKKVKIRALYNYCKGKGVTPNQLTKEEMKCFIIEEIE